MRVVVAIFAIGGVLIGAALVLGIAIEPDQAGAPTSASSPAGVRCRPPEGPLTLVEPTPEVVDRVNAAWERVDGWLADNAVATAAAWNTPATRSELVGLQRDLGSELPAELIISLTRHDGVGADGFTFPPAYQPLSVREIRTTTADLCADPGWREGDVPFAKGESGAVLYLHEGNVYRFPAMQLHATDLTELLNRTASRLEGDSPADYRPDIDALGRLRWVRE
ncbi:hypothetical protein JOD54_001640 [Actinokineospora baliensis]|uniref:SMI1/KNR4 family protein n=1 Tax=Actinokineospora baliensis TaxID=547056 RepID=UPI00195841CC|nr:SMI1/KNR4 family protein [Actinokineospora baliensis]MBM7771436.1 hypothetical protein [Actinokineospora baliensis]